MPGFSELRFYSGDIDGEMVRISMFNQRGHEYWRAIPGGEGRDYRERRDEAVSAIWRAIVEQREPGHVA
jgi:hypothetical protein